MMELVQKVVNCLENGGVVLLPTDTVLGLAAKPDDPRAVDKVYALKNRPREKNLPIMVADIEQIRGLGADVTSNSKKLLESALVPGALTIAFGVVPEKLTPWLAKRIEFAVRVPKDDLLLEVLKQTGPLLVSSANISGHDTPRTTSEVLSQLNAEPDLIVEGAQHASTASTLVNCNLEPPKIERQGAISRAEIEAIVGALQ